MREIFRAPREDYTRTLIHSAPALPALDAAMTALHPVSMKFSRTKPRIVAVVGQSGSGKTTCGALMLGFHKPTTGRVLYKGHDINRAGRGEARTYRREVQAIFQDPCSSFNPFYTVDHAFVVPLTRFGIAGSRREVHDRMGDALEKGRARAAVDLRQPRAPAFGRAAAASDGGAR